MAYLKLDQTILDSSIWVESPIVLKVFLTMLLMADQAGDGICRAMAPGISVRARLAPRHVRDALQILSGPDPDDKSGVDEGRRIRKVPGGYEIVNWVNYQKKDHTAAERQRRRRAKLSRVTERDSHGLSRTQTQTKTQTQGKDDGSVVPTSPLEPEKELSGAIAPATVTAEVVDENFAWSRSACDDWIARFGGTPPAGQIGSTFKPLIARYGWPTVRKAWRAYLLASEAQYASPTRFSNTYGKWAGLTPDPAPKDDVTAHNERFLQDYAQRRQREGVAAAKALPTMPKARG